MKQKEPIPVTVLTGFLGTGKTTLLNHLLTQSHGYHCAIRPEIITCRSLMTSIRR